MPTEAKSVLLVTTAPLDSTLVHRVGARERQHDERGRSFLLDSFFFTLDKKPLAKKMDSQE